MKKNIYQLYKEQLETPWDQPWEKKNVEKDDFTSELLSMLSMPDGDVLITVVGINNYFENKPFVMDKKLHLVKEPGNKYDANAISVICDNFGKCGYVANSIETVKQGTHLADIIHGGIGDGCTAQVLWTDDAFVICKLCEIDNYRFVYNNAVDYCYENSFAIALELFLALEKVCETVEVLQRICGCYIKLEEFAKALDYAEKALSLEKDNKRSNYMKSVIIDKLKGE